MEKAKTLGWNVHLVYLGVDDISIQLERIQRRVRLENGHDIPEEIVRRRFSKSFSNLYEAIAISDSAIVFDNSQESKPEPLMYTVNGNISWKTASPPEWLKRILARIDLINALISAKK